MTTTGQRLVFDSGLSGGTASVLLKAMGAGATAGARLVAYSHLGSTTAMIHLLANPQTATVPSGGGGGTRRYRGLPRYWWQEAKDHALVIPEEIPLHQDLESIQVEMVTLESFISDLRYDRIQEETLRILTAYQEVLQEQADERLAAEMYGKNLAVFESAKKRATRMRKIAMLLLN